MKLIYQFIKYLKYCMSSMKLSFITFITTSIVDGLLFFNKPFINGSKSFLFTVRILITIICIFSGISWILLVLNKIYKETKSIINKKFSNKQIINRTIAVIYSSQESKKDIIKICDNNLQPTSLLNDNTTIYLKNNDVIKENIDMYPNKPMEKVYSLTNLGIKACKSIISQNKKQ